jgi:hypothetical protein
MPRFSGCLLPLVAVFAFAPSLASADPESPEKEACRQEQRAQGDGELAAKATCAVKALFQSRIRRRGKEEPVEMTVGSPPMQSEDSDTPGDGNWEINLALGADWNGDGHALEFPVADVNYGIGDRIQLTMELPYVSLHQDAADGLPASGAHGVGDTTLGMKYRFYDNEDRGISMAVYPQWRVRAPFTDSDVSEGPAFVLPLILVSEFESFSLTANAGVEFADGERRSFASIGAGRRLTPEVALLGELAGTDLNGGEDRRIAFNVGLRRKLSDTQSLSMAIGRDVSTGGAPRENHLVLNYQRLFGEAKK